MVAPIPELMATFRVLVVPWALPSNECECDCEVLTVEAPISVRLVRTGSSLTEGPDGPYRMLLTVNSDEENYDRPSLDCQQSTCNIFG